MLMTAEYKNGYGLKCTPDNNKEMTVADMFGLAENAGGMVLPRLQYRRNEPVKPPAFFPMKRLLNEERTEVEDGMEGESLHHMVIRSNGQHNAYLRTVRHILPPHRSAQRRHQRTD